MESDNTGVGFAVDKMMHFVSSTDSYVFAFAQ